jgi:hypothetical protein
VIGYRRGLDLDGRARRGARRRGSAAVHDRTAARGAGGRLLGVGQVARPYAAVDGMSAAALRSMAGALRQELRLGGVRGVAVSTVLVGVDSSVGRTATTVVVQLRRPRLEVVAGGPLETALTHGHPLVPGPDGVGRRRARPPECGVLSRSSRHLRITVRTRRGNRRRSEG